MPKYIVTRTEKFSKVIVAPNLDQARDTLDAMSGDDWIVPDHSDETLTEIPDMTEAQMDSIRTIHEWHGIERPLGDYMASAYHQIGYDDGSLMIEAKGIWYGIEADGSRHT
jgi:hypothetical protein